MGCDIEGGGGYYELMYRLGNFCMCSQYRNIGMEHNYDDIYGVLCW